MAGDLTFNPNSFGVHRRNSTGSYVEFVVPLARVGDLTRSTHDFVFPSVRPLDRPAIELVIPFIAATMRFAPLLLAENQSVLYHDCLDGNGLV